MKINRIVALFVSVALVAMMVMPVFAGGTPDYTSELWAGRKREPVGNVLVQKSGGHLYITYTTTGCWRLVETHLAVADELGGIPMTKSGNPKIGKFAYSGSHSMVTSVQYVVDLDDIPNTDVNTILAIAAHAVVCCTCDGRCETAWAQGPAHEDFPGNSIAIYFMFG